MERNGVVWSLHDNGGEINMGRVNDSAPDMNAPYTAGGVMLAGATVGYRVLCLMADLPVDWAFGVPTTIVD